MNFYDIKPYIRHAEKLYGKNIDSNEPRASYDHVIIYILSGSANVIINEQMYSVDRGNIIIIKPGSFYEIIAEAQTAMINIHFDYGNEAPSKKSFYQEPANEENFLPHKIIENFLIEDEDVFNEDLVAYGFNSLEETFCLILSEFERTEKYYDFRISSCLISILVEVCRKVKADNNLTISNKIDTGAELLEYIHKNYSKNISVEEIASHFRFHSSYVNRLVKSKTGYSVHKYIMVRRISKSIELLQSTNMRIYEIAEEIGFPDVSHFSKTFKQIMGKSPNEYRKGGKLL